MLKPQVLSQILNQRIKQHTKPLQFSHPDWRVTDYYYYYYYIHLTNSFPVLDLYETMGLRDGCGIIWTICKQPAPHSRQITTPTPHTQFFQAGCPSCLPTNSVEALKALHYWWVTEYNTKQQMCLAICVDIIHLPLWYSIQMIFPLCEHFSEGDGFSKAPFYFWSRPTIM